MAQKAFDNGITHSQTKGRLNKWVTGLYFRNKNANNILNLLMTHLSDLV